MTKNDIIFKVRKYTASQNYGGIFLKINKTEIIIF